MSRKKHLEDVDIPDTIKSVLKKFESIVCDDVEEYIGVTIQNKERHEWFQKVWDYIFKGNAPFWKTVRIRPKGKQSLEDARKEWWDKAYDRHYENSEKNIKAICKILLQIIHLSFKENFVPEGKPDERFDFVEVLPPPLRQKVISLVMYQKPSSVSTLLRVSKGLTTDVLDSPDYIAFRESIFIANIAAKIGNNYGLRFCCQLSKTCFRPLMNLFRISLSNGGISVKTDLLAIMNSGYMTGSYRNNRDLLKQIRDSASPESVNDPKYENLNLFVTQCLGQIDDIAIKDGYEWSDTKLNTNVRDKISCVIELFEGMALLSNILSNGKIKLTNMRGIDSLHDSYSNLITATFPWLVDDIPRFIFWYLALTNYSIPFYFTAGLLDDTGNYENKSLIPLLNDSARSEQYIKEHKLEDEVLPVEVLADFYLVSGIDRKGKKDEAALCRVTGVDVEKLKKYLAEHKTKWDQSYKSERSVLFSKNISVKNLKVQEQSDLSQETLALIYIPIHIQLGIQRERFGIYSSIYDPDLLNRITIDDADFIDLMYFALTKPKSRDLYSLGLVLLANIVRGISQVTPVIYTNNGISQEKTFVIYKGFMITFGTSFVTDLNKIFIEEVRYSYNEQKWNSGAIGQRFNAIKGDLEALGGRYYGNSRMHSSFSINTIIDLQHEKLNFVNVMELLALLLPSQFFAIHYAMVSSYSEPEYIKKRLKISMSDKYTFEVVDKVLKLVQMVRFDANKNAEIYPMTMFSFDTVCNSVKESKTTKPATELIEYSNRAIVTPSNRLFVQDYCLNNGSPYRYEYGYIKLFENNGKPQDSHSKADVQYPYWQKMAKEIPALENVYNPDMTTTIPLQKLIQSTDRYGQIGLYNILLVFNPYSVALNLPFKIAVEYTDKLKADIRTARVNQSSRLF